MAKKAIPALQGHKALLVLTELTEPQAQLALQAQRVPQVQQEQRVRKVQRALMVQMVQTVRMELPDLKGQQAQLVLQVQQALQAQQGLLVLTVQMEQMVLRQRLLLARFRQELLALPSLSRIAAALQQLSSTLQYLEVQPQLLVYKVQQAQVFQLVEPVANFCRKQAALTMTPVG